MQIRKKWLNQLKNFFNKRFWGYYLASFCWWISSTCENHCILLDIPGDLFPGLLLLLHLPLLLALLLLKEGGHSLLLLLLLLGLLVAVELAQHLEGVGHLPLLVVQHHRHTLAVRVARLPGNLIKKSGILPKDEVRRRDIGRTQCCGSETI